MKVRFFMSFWFFMLSMMLSINAQKLDSANITLNMKRMKGLLLNNYLKRDFVKMGGVLSNDLGLEVLKKNFLSTSDSVESFHISIELADQLIKSGKIKEAIYLIKKSQKKITEISISDSIDVRLRLNKMLAIAYIREAEKEYKINNDSGNFDLFGKHKAGFSLRAMIDKSIKIYLIILDSDSADLQSRWLLNICYQILGDYPESVPSKYLIPFNKYNRSDETTSFNNISSELNLNFEGLAGCPAMEDFDKDGDLDLFFCSQGYNSSCKFIVNNGDGTFSDHTKEAGLEGVFSGRVLSHADYNNDGFPDVFIARGAWSIQKDNFQPNSLLRNNGNGTFTDVTIESGLLSFNPTSSVSWGDYNNDGWLDIFVGNETVDPAFPMACQLYTNNANGTFSENSSKVNAHIIGFIKAVVWGDYDNDGWLDLYVSDLNGYNHLLKNMGKDKYGELKFKDVAREAGVLEPFCSQSVFFFDYNNDGWQDIFIPAYPYMSDNLSISIPADYLGGYPVSTNSYPKLYKNNKDGSFSDVSSSMNFNRIMYANACNYGDIDNDGFLDIYLGTGDLQLASLFPNIMLKNNNAQSFDDVTSITATGSILKGQGIAFGDIDNDGDNDIVEVMGGGYQGEVSQCLFLENQGNLNHWINIELLGVGSNKSAIGARIKLVFVDGTETREVYSTVNTGGSNGSSSLSRQIGMGKATSAKLLEVYWPKTKTFNRYKNLNVNNFYKITEGKTKIEKKYFSKINLHSN